jgi:biopolymer transport protein ExbD
MQQDANPITRGHATAASDAESSARRRVRTGAAESPTKPELKLTSMIDVVFLLLIFFVVTANFTEDEASLQAALPGDSSPIDQTKPPVVPVRVDLRSSDDGVTYSLLVDDVSVDGAAALSAHMKHRVATGQMSVDDVVRITPQNAVRWQHVLNVYNACVAADLEQVAFARE